MKRIIFLVFMSVLLVSCSNMSKVNDIVVDSISVDEKVDNKTILSGKYCKIVLPKTYETEKENLYSNIDVLNTQFEKEIKNFIETTKSEYSSADNEEKKSFLYEYSQKGNIITNNESVLSILSNTYIDTMGAHGGTLIKCYNYDMLNGQKIKLSNLILDSNGLKNLIINKLNSDEYKDISLFDDYVNTIDNFFDFSKNDNSLEFNILDDGINFIFNQYDIAPYSDGIITVNFSIDEIKDIIMGYYWE